MSKTTSNLLSSKPSLQTSKYFSPPPPVRSTEQSWPHTSPYSRFSITPANIASFSLTHLTDSDMEQGGEDGCAVGGGGCSRGDLPTGRDVGYQMLSWYLLSKFEKPLCEALSVLSGPHPAPQAPVTAQAPHSSQVSPLGSCWASGRGRAEASSVALGRQHVPQQMLPLPFSPSSLLL